MKPNRAAPAPELLPNIEALEGKLVHAYLAGLRDRNPRARRKAARALGYLGRAAADAVPALDALREDDNPAVRGAARWALARIAASAGR
jgi:HEAT repeat protein